MTGTVKTIQLFFISFTVEYSYDEIGNPLSWYTGATMSWQHGRQLAGYSDSANTIVFPFATAVQFRRKVLRLISPCCGTTLRARCIRPRRRSLLGSYDDNGIRTSKTVNSTTTSYTVVDGTLRRMTDGTNTL